eukprot:gene44446-55277_t
MGPAVVQYLMGAVPNTWAELTIQSASAAAHYMRFSAQIYPDMAMKLIDSRVIQNLNEEH